MVGGCTRMRGNRKGSPLSRNLVWICEAHWRVIPRRMKAIFRRAEKREAALEAKLGSDHPKVWAAGSARHRIYLRMGRAAFELGMGI
jgi:hypothetical protein